MAGAPVSPRAPPATTTVPEVNFEPSRRAVRVEARAPARTIRPGADGAGRAARHADLHHLHLTRVVARPAPRAGPTLEPWKVAVTSARTASPATSPEEASTPEGTSQATTGASWRVDRGDRAGHGLARLARRSPCPAARPPRRPSPPGPRARTAPGAAPGSRSRLAAASPRSSSSGAMASTSTSRPSSRSSRATTRPSPPLLPLPTTTRIGPRARHRAPSPAPGRSPRAPSGRARARPAPRSPTRRRRASRSAS